MSALVFGFRRRGRIYLGRAELSEAVKEAIAISHDRRAFEARRARDSIRARAYGMAARLFDNGRDAFNTKTIGFTTDTIKALLLDCSAPGTYLKLITGGVTNANPAVYTSASHGFANNDVLVAGGIGGNLSANQTGLAASVATNTFQMTTLEGLAVAGSGAYTSGGYVIDLTQATFVAGILGNRVGTDQTLAGKTSSRGVANATSPITWPTVPAGNPVQAVVFYDAAGGSDASNRVIAWQDGKVRVRVDKAVVATDTSIVVEPLRGQLWDGATGPAPVIYWSDGHSSTLNAAANQGDSAITITSQAAGGVALGSTADVTTFGAGLPVTPSGGSIAFSIGTIYAPTNPTGIYVL